MGNEMSGGNAAAGAESKGWGMVPGAHEIESEEVAARKKFRVGFHHRIHGGHREPRVDASMTYPASTLRWCHA